MAVQAAALVRLDGCQHRVEAPVYVTRADNHLLTANPGDCLQPGATGTKQQNNMQQNAVTTEQRAASEFYLTPCVCMRNSTSSRTRLPAGLHSI